MKSTPGGPRSERQNESAKSVKNESAENYNFKNIEPLLSRSGISLIFMGNQTRDQVPFPSLGGSTNFGALVKIYLGALVLVLWTSSGQV